MPDTISIAVTVPDGKKAAIIDDFCAYHGYTDTIPGPDNTVITNPQTKAQFFKEKIARFVRESVKAWRANKEAEVSRKAAADAVDAMNIQ